MNKTPEDKKLQRPKSAGATWGPGLFVLVFIAILAFFYWLLIYSGGIGTNH